jgi:hypothetical protein
MNRDLIIREYYLLRNFLNRSNKIANQKSELKFIIEQFGMSNYRMYAVIVGQGETHQIAIATRDISKVWERTGLTEFRLFENYCADFLNEFEKKWKFPKSNLTLPLNFINKAEIEIKNNLSTLLLDELS